MIKNNPGKTHPAPSPSAKTRKRAGRRDPAGDIPVTSRLLRNLSGLLPAGMTPRTKRIVITSGVLVFTIIALFVTGVIIANVTGFYDQLLTIVAAEIVLVGVVTAAVMLLTARTRAG